MDEGRRGGAEWVNEGRVVDEGRGVAFFFSFMEGGVGAGGGGLGRAVGETKR